MQNDNKNLKFVVIIPAYNEEEFLGLCLDSLLKQTLHPSQIIVVDDASTDSTFQIAKKYANDFDNISVVSSDSKAEHRPGAKVINAFKKGLEYISLSQFDIVCKFDADLIFPSNYLSILNEKFLENTNLGLCGGVCSIKKNGDWETENLTNNDHVRGALKAYRIKAYEDMGGLSSQMGWDTADEFKLRYRNWKLQVMPNLKVKHLKPTAVAYHNDYFEKQGRVFYALRYSFLLTLIAALKISKQRNQLLKYKIVLRSFQKSKKEQLNYLLTEEEGRFLRQYRWKRIRRKIMP